MVVGFDRVKFNKVAEKEVQILIDIHCKLNIVSTCKNVLQFVKSVTEHHTSSYPVDLQSCILRLTSEWIHFSYQADGFY